MNESKLYGNSISRVRTRGTHLGVPLGGVQYCLLWRAPRQTQPLAKVLCRLLGAAWWPNKSGSLFRAAHAAFLARAVAQGVRNAEKL